MADEIQVGFKFSVPEAVAEIRAILSTAIENAFIFIERNFQVLIVDRLLYGGKGWSPLIETAGWKWINSPRGLAQLGFTNSLEPYNLLSAIGSSMMLTRVTRLNKASDSVYIGLVFKIGRLEDIYRNTIHPAAGTLKLPSDRSWFQWVYSGKALKEKNVKFTRTGPSKGVRSSAIAGAEAGKMTKGTFWEVPPKFRIDLDKLIDRNRDKMTNVITKTIQEIVTRELK
jgi:hypothetical protein